MKKLLATMLCSLFLVGCNSGLVQQDIVKQLISAPEVKGISLKSFSAKDQSVVFDVDLYNPNLFPLPISGLSGDFQLNQVSVGSVAAKSEGNLAAQATQTVTLPIKLNSDALSSAAQQALGSGQVNYSFNGGVATSAGEVPVSKSGKLSIADLTKALFR